MAREGIQLLADRAGVPYQEAYKEQMGYVPLGKMSTPEELGKVAEFYLTNTEVSTTGQSIDVNNGAFMI
jgi:enoyl-[acyl-carrier-protein] reductase (NADH)